MVGGWILVVKWSGNRNGFEVNGGYHSEYVVECALGSSGVQASAN